VSLTLDELVRVEDKAFYDGGQFEIYRRLQVENPVFYYEPLDLFVLSKYADIRHVARTPELFSSTGGLSLSELRLAASGANRSRERLFDPSGELVITLDPPRHRKIRATLTPAFNPRAIADLEVAIRAISSHLVSKINDGEPIEFVEAIAAELPLLVAAAVLGVSDDNLDDIKKWVAALETWTNVESEDDLQSASREFARMNKFFRDQLERKRKEPGSDLISMLLASHIDGAPLTEPHLLSHLTTLMSNGGTTRLLLANMALLLAENPSQLAQLVKDNDSIPAAIEESLRIFPSARGFVRTAKSDVIIRGQEIRSGQRLYLLYDAGNRDPEIFDQPENFDLNRPQQNKHLSFGFGTHSCLGAALVRMEVDIFYRELLRRFSQVAVVEEPNRLRHLQLNGWESLQLSFAP
jgi:cytochrome P450